MKCFYCEEELVWCSDEMLGDMSGLDLEEGEDKLISFYVCPKCGAEYEVYQKCD